MPIETVTHDDFWDCECDYGYIHPKEQKLCMFCETYSDDQPDSREEEILEQYPICLTKQKAPDVELTVCDVPFTFSEEYIQDNNYRGQDGILTTGGWHALQFEAVKEYLILQSMGLALRIGTLNDLNNVL